MFQKRPFEALSWDGKYLVKKKKGVGIANIFISIWNI
jgi:hypothetical protein